MTARWRSAVRGQAGQASVELVAVLPLLAAIALAVGQVLASGAGRELAANAAQAGAMALVQGGDPERAARAAVRGRWEAGAVIAVRGRTVSVALRPRGPIPGLRDLLAARAEATAGP